MSQISVPQMLIRQTVEAFGGLDILITNSGGPTPGSIDSLDEVAWQKGIDSSLMAHVRLIKAALPYLRKSDSASVLDVYLLFGETTDPEFAHLQQRPRCNGGTYQIACIGTWQGGNPLNSILPGWTMTERVTGINDNSVQRTTIHLLRKKPPNKLQKFPLDAWGNRRSLQMRLYFWSPRPRHIFTAFHWGWMAALSKGSSSNGTRKNTFYFLYSALHSIHRDRSNSQHSQKSAPGVGRLSGCRHCSANFHYWLCNPQDEGKQT